MTHVEYLVHFRPVGARLLLDELEKRGDREQVVLDDMFAADEMHHLGLGASRAVNHSVDLSAHFGKDLLDDRSIRARGRQDELARSQTGVLNRSVEASGAGIDEIVRNGRIEAFGVAFGYIFGEYVVARRGKSVASHSSVVLFLIRSLAERCEADYDVAGGDVGVVGHIGAILPRPCRGDRRAVLLCR